MLYINIREHTLYCQNIDNNVLKDAVWDAVSLRFVYTRAAPNQYTMVV